MSDYTYTQDFVYDSGGSVINNSIFGGTIADGDDDNQFESGDLLFGVHSYAGTMTVEGIVMPVFLRSDGSHHVFNPGPNYVTPPVAVPAITNAPFAFCFGEGTLISTPSGSCAVENLAIGDMVVTNTGATVPVKWIGRQTLYKIFAGPRVQPVRIQKGALGNGVPNSDLTVTGDHGMEIDGFVINASALVNGDTIDWIPLAELDDSFVVYHVETEAHDVILANGAAAETFVSVSTRSHFDNHQEYLDLYGCERVIAEMNSLRISSQRLLPTEIKKRLGIIDAEIGPEPRLTA
ncbi:MAG: Hint domain-containing protein [Sulfitobacter sp.]